MIDLPRHSFVIRWISSNNDDVVPIFILVSDGSMLGALLSLESQMFISYEPRSSLELGRLLASYLVPYFFLSCHGFCDLFHSPFDEGALHRDGFTYLEIRKPNGWIFQHFRKIGHDYSQYHHRHRYQSNPILFVWGDYLGNKFFFGHFAFHGLSIGNGLLSLLVLS
jgi:hypothetical protein